MTELEKAIYFLNNASGCIQRALTNGLEVDGHLGRTLKALEDLQSTVKCVDDSWKPAEPEKEELE